MTETDRTMTNGTVAVGMASPKLADGVLGLEDVPPADEPGVRAFVHYNGPTDMLRGMCTGMCVLQPGATPHAPHRHAEEEFMIVSSGSGEIVVGDTTTEVGPGAIMYCAGNVLHGISNTGSEPMTFYWSKWLK